MSGGDPPHGASGSSSSEPWPSPIAGGYLQKSAFSPRYASVIFIPLLLLVALGLGTFMDRRIASVILVASAVFGLVTSLPNIDTQRSQAFQVAQVLARAGKPGDIVAFCPDQLGPDTAPVCCPPEGTTRSPSREVTARSSSTGSTTPRSSPMPPHRPSQSASSR